VAVGKTVTFSWTLANTGKHPAYGVVGSITLPTTGVSNPQPSDGVVVTGSVATFTLDELAANAEKKLSVTLTVDANAPKELEATASAGAANATSPRKTLTTHVSPQVKVEGTAAPARTVAGGETTYVWTVVNDSTTLEVPDVTLTAVLPPAAKVTRVDASHYGTVQDGKITWPKTLLAAGGQLTRTVTVALSPDVTTIEAVTATATAPQLAEVTSQPVAVQIDTPETYLQLTARSTPEQATLASKVTYELTASNAGPSALSGATLTLTPTPHVTLSEATTQTGNEPPRSAPLTTAESGYTLDLPTLLPVAQQAAEIDYQVVELVPGLPPASPTVNGTYSGRIVTADAIFPTLTAQQITDRKNTGHFDDVINYQARGSVVAAAVQGNDHTVDATDVRVIGIDLDLRGMNNKLVILHLGTLNVSGILGDNNTLNVSNIRVIGVRAKIDLGSRTQLIISGGSINADVINGSTNHVKADKVSAAAVLLQYYANGKAIPTLPKEASTVQGPGTSTPVAITVR
ncbi:hypothetical protein ACGFYF_42500, partial [Streptomyces lavendulae]|uniref:hypothetical protein n=1 Tax=Streptomyces lavendulae TaxID=1914 RepID=UPI003718DF9E